MVIKLKNKKNKGQALFEFVIFTPFFVAFFAIMIEIVGAINGSINQQKVTRGFFYRLVKGNSTIPATDDLNDFAGAIQEIGAYSIGWKEAEDGKTPIATCYKITKLPGAKYEDTCQEGSVGEEPTGFFRVFTSYGVCSTSYTTQGNGGVFYYDHFNRGFESCKIR